MSGSTSVTLSEGPPVEPLTVSSESRPVQEIGQDLKIQWRQEYQPTSLSRCPFKFEPHPS